MALVLQGRKGFIRFPRLFECIYTILETSGSGLVKLLFIIGEERLR